MITFNLGKFRKKAFYDDGRGHMISLTRAKMNCIKKKLDNGISSQEAWCSCQKEYEDGGDWSLKNASGDPLKK